MVEQTRRAIRELNLFLAAGAIALAAALSACMALPPTAYAENVQLNAPTTVSDDITRLHVNKLDADTHEYVLGATLAIINEETGEVVDSWVTGSGTHENEKGLDVDVVYILRELKAPDGYGSVSDVRFIVNETEGTGITVLTKGDDAELTESYKVNLYDKAGAAQTSTNVSTSSSASKTVAPKTGDETPLTTIASLVVAGILLIIVLQVPKRRISAHDDD